MIIKRIVPEEQAELKIIRSEKKFSWFHYVIWCIKISCFFIRCPGCWFLSLFPGSLSDRSGIWPWVLHLSHHGRQELSYSGSPWFLFHYLSQQVFWLLIPLQKKADELTCVWTSHLSCPSCLLTWQQHSPLFQKQLLDSWAIISRIVVSAIRVNDSIISDIQSIVFFIQYR